MLGKIYPVTILRASVAALFLIVAISFAAQDHDVPVSVDGMRCDSCGSECSMHCGSRTFRTCCYNYIKKRSIPWPSSSSGGGENSEDESLQETLKSSSGPVTTSSAIKSANTGATSSIIPMKPTLLLKQSGGTGSQHIFQRYVVPDPLSGVGVDSIEEEELLYPLTLKDLMTSIIRTLKAYENKKLPRTYLI